MAASVKGVERRFVRRKSKEEFVLGKSTLLKETHTEKQGRGSTQRGGGAPQTKHR